MCGICGFAGPGDEAVIKAMCARMVHRGPDGQGVYHHSGQRLFFGHLRLAIVDLASGAQPMATADNGLVVTFNGEIYNHLELRRELEAAGHRFLTDHSDTEVLLHGYRQWGAALPEKLNGMWAFAIHDVRKHEVFLSRDRFGKKPLYYHLKPEFFAFASELTGLKAHPQVPDTLDPAALRKYFAYAFIPAPNSLYAGVRKLPGGHNLLVSLRDYSSRVTRYWTYRVEPYGSLPKNAEAVWSEQIRDLLDKAVRRRLMSDVPLGVFLSGGIDSSAITAMASRHVDGLRTFSVGFTEASFDESAQSMRAAKLFRTVHQQDTLSLEKALDILPGLVSKLDEPMGDSSLLPTYLLCRETRKHVTVALGGDGADELFAGYEPFKILTVAERYNALCPRPVHRAVRLLAARLPVSHSYMAFAFKANRMLSGLSYPKALWNSVWIGTLEPELLAELFSGPCDLDEIYSEAIAAWDEATSNNLADKTLEFFAKLYMQDGILTKVDRASMLNSLEVRAPFLDIELVDLVRHIPHDFKIRRGQTKFILKKALEPVLPQDILSRRKQGFGVPVGLWFHTGALKLDRGILPGSLNASFVARMEDAHRAGKNDHRNLLWNLWVLARHPRGRAA